MSKDAMTLDITREVRTETDGPSPKYVAVLPVANGYPVEEPITSAQRTMDFAAPPPRPPVQGQDGKYDEFLNSSN